MIILPQTIELNMLFFATLILMLCGGILAVMWVTRKMIKVINRS